MPEPTTATRPDSIGSTRQRACRAQLQTRIPYGCGSSGNPPVQGRTGRQATGIDQGRSHRLQLVHIRLQQGSGRRRSARGWHAGEGRRACGLKGVGRQLATCCSADHGIIVERTDPSTARPCNSRYSARRASVARAGDRHPGGVLDQSHDRPLAPDPAGRSLASCPWLDDVHGRFQSPRASSTLQPEEGREHRHRHCTVPRFPVHGVTLKIVLVKQRCGAYTTQPVVLCQTIVQDNIGISATLW